MKKHKKIFRLVFFYLIILIIIATIILTVLSIFDIIKFDENEKKTIYGFFFAEIGGGVTFLFKYLFDSKDEEDSSENNPSKDISQNDFSNIGKDINKEFDHHGLFKLFEIQAREIQIPADYLFNIGIQKLLNAATLIHPMAVSANFWVCHEKVKDNHFFFRSDQREGNFRFDQMVAKTSQGIQFRGNIFKLDLSEINNLPVYVKVVKTRKIEIVSIDDKIQAFDSRFEKELGITHIVGIPAISSDQNEYFPNQPMSITIDLQIKEAKLKELKEIEEDAKKIKAWLIELSSFWIKNIKKNA